MTVSLKLDDELAARVIEQADATTGGNVQCLIRLCILQSLNPQQFQEEIRAYADHARD